MMNFEPVEVDTPEPLSEAAQAWVDARRVAHAAGESGTTEPSGLSNDDLHALHANLVYNMDFAIVADLMHPVWNGSTSLQKWRQVAQLSDGSIAVMAWGYSIE